MIFKQILTEKIEGDSDYNGIRVYGDVVNVSIKKADNNNTTELKVDGSKTLSKVQSAEKTKGEYLEDDWLTIEKQYESIMEKSQADIEKAVSIFEKSLAKIAKDLEKATSKY